MRKRIEKCNVTDAQMQQTPTKQKSVFLKQCGQAAQSKVSCSICDENQKAQDAGLFMTLACM